LELAYIEAGRNVYVEIKPDIQPSVPVHVKVSLDYKNSGEQPFTLGCDVVRKAPDKMPGLVFGAIPDSQTYLFKPLWRLEFRYEGSEVLPRNGGTPITIRVFRDLDPEREWNGDPANGTLQGDLSLAFMCEISAGTRTRPAASPTIFAQSAVLKIRILDNTKSITPSNRQKLHQLVRDAVAVWRRSCAKCRPENLVFVEIDGTMYWMPTAFALLTDSGDLSGPQSQTIILRDLRGTRSPTPGYVALNRNDPGIIAICGISAESAGDDVKAIQQALHCGGVSRASEAVMSLLLPREHTSCGQDPNIIACEPDLELVEFDLQNYTFYSPGPGSKLFGTGNRKVDFLHVVLHEIGHWIGISGHINVGESIMAEYMEDSRCIDNATIDAMGKTSPTFVSEESRKQAFRFRRPH
jgi:hypothetical protein